MSDDLVKYLKKYVDNQVQYQSALKIVQKHKKLQDKIKDIYQSRKIQEYVLHQDGYHVKLEYRPTTYYKIDTALLPESLKERFKKQVVMRKEHLSIYKTPS
jgi:hypothetical protein